MVNDPENPPSPGLEIGFAVAVGMGFLVANVFCVLLADQFSLFDEYLKTSCLFIGAACVLVIAKSRIGEAGAVALSVISRLIVLLNFMFIGYGSVG